MRYVLKKGRRVIINDTVTKKHKLTIVELKQCQLTGGQDTFYAEGADGVRLVGFDQNKTSGFSFTSGVVSTGVLAAQTGGEYKSVSNGTGILFREEFTLGADQIEVTLAHKASGTTGNEVKWIYKLDSTGEPGDGFAQAAKASATEFAYDPTTKKITLPTGVFGAGSVVCVDYFPTFSKYNELSNEADKFSITGEVYFDAFWTDVCTKQDRALQMYCPAGKVSGAIDLSFGDAVATQSVEIEGLANMCAGKQKTLWVLRDYDTGDIVDE